MPANRRTNAAKRGSSQRKQQGPLLTGAAKDIVAVACIVVAIAMIISLVSESSAPVTQATGDFLRLCFGIGAILVPVGIILFACTMFVEDEKNFSSRIAIALTLIVLSILALISQNILGAEANPDQVLFPLVAKSHGGFVGGAIAWALLKSVGSLVGNILLVGIIISAIILCGFSISKLVTKLRARFGVLNADLKDKLNSQKELKAAQKAARLREREAELEAQQVVQFDQEEAPKTTFLGSRRTSVLSRKAAESPEPNPDLAPDPDNYVEAAEEIAPPTRLLKRKKKEEPALDMQELDFEQEDTTTVEPEPQIELAPKEPAVPEFLKQQQTKSSKKKEKKEDFNCSTTKAAKPKKASSSRPGDVSSDFELPPMSMLNTNPKSANSASSKAELDETKAKLQATLEEFGLSSKVVDYISGPIVTTFMIEMGEGERVNRITNLEDDIALTLAADKVRIYAPIRGTSYVGIEIPNKSRSSVYLGDVLPSAGSGLLEVAIGRNSAGKPVIADIAKMPHMLVAGTTGSGKSVMINAMIMSLLMRTTPKQVRLIMIDPKRVEFSAYQGLPHLYVPVVTEPRQAAGVLQWAVSEMDRRFKVFEKASVKNIEGYNISVESGALSQMENPPEPMPYMIVVIDELSDLMMVAGKDVEASIMRLAQLARAAGIHLVVATQRPSANVVTGMIKSNIDTRVALKVSSGIDSRVILDETGAERLLGNGDMLFRSGGLSPTRVLGCYTADEEIEAVVEFLRSQGEPDYHEEILTQVVPAQTSGGGAADLEEADDPLIWEAAQIVVESQFGSTSGLQRRLKVGYARAGRIMDMLEAKGVVGPQDGSKPREVLLDMDELRDLRDLDAQYREV